MKNSILLLLVLLSVSYYSLGQINSYQVVSSKEYADNTQTAYLEFDVKIDASFKEAITEEIMSNPLISNFSFYNKTDLSKCMFSADMSIDVETIVQMINDIVDNYIEAEGGRFINVWNDSTGQEVFFQIDGVISDLQRKQLAEVLMKDSLIKNAVINGSDCKIITLQKVSPEYIQIILDSFDVKINQSSFE